MSAAPRPRTSSSPSSPVNLSASSEPESRPPLGQPGRSFVIVSASGSPGCTELSDTVLTPALLSRSTVRVPAHRASSDAVGSGERPCSCLLASVLRCASSLGASERIPTQPTARRTTHPIRRPLTTATRYPWRPTVPPLPLHVSLATSTSEHVTLRSPAHLQGRLIHERRRILHNCGCGWCKVSK